MELDLLTQKVSALNCKEFEGMDVYEYSERVIDYLSDGRLLKIETRDRRPFMIEEFGCISPYYGFHSVVMVVCREIPFVVDVAARTPVMPLSDYLRHLSKMNRNREFCSEVLPFFGKAAGAAFGSLNLLNQFI